MVSEGTMKDEERGGEVGDKEGEWKTQQPPAAKRSTLEVTLLGNLPPSLPCLLIYHTTHSFPGMKVWPCWWETMCSIGTMVSLQGHWSSSSSRWDIVLPISASLSV